MTDTAPPAPGASIAIEGVPNLRDLGGWATPDGVVRRGVAYRSALVHELGPEAAGALRALGLRRVVDFRTEAERAAEPSGTPSDLDGVAIDVLGSVPGGAPAQLQALLADPAVAEQHLGGGRGVELMTRAYRDIVDLPSAVSGYRRFFDDLADPRLRPVLFHCATGKDRTGWAAAVLLLALGVALDDVVADYLATNDQLLPALEPQLARAEAAGVPRGLLVPVLGVRREYLQTALDEMESRFGTVDRYLTEGLGLDPSTLARLRDELVER